MHHKHQDRHRGPCMHEVETCEQHTCAVSACVQAEGLAADPALSPGGPFDGRPGDFALSKLNFYQCSRAGCQRVYYGGKKECRAQAAEGEQAHLSGAKSLLQGPMLHLLILCQCSHVGCQRANH